MNRHASSIVLAASLALVACGDRAVGSAHHPGSSSSELTVTQGQQMQGQQMQGQQMQGASLGTGPATVAEVPIAHDYSGWFVGWHWSGGPAQLTQGRLSVPDKSGRLLSGADLIGALVPALQGGNRIWTQITDVKPDPTYADGSTFLYSLDIIASDGTRTPLCGPDLNGVSAAIPIAATFNPHGDRVESNTQFTFGCTFGVIAKCYRWGYRPWIQGAAPSAEFTNLHQACTRMARADYCGNGQTWTHNGTLINLWDRAPAPGPFQDHGSPPPEFIFEAGWSTKGAVCLSKQRWATLPPEVAQSCPDRLIAPGVATASGTVCDSEIEAGQFDSATQLFNESKVNVQ